MNCLRIFVGLVALFSPVLLTVSASAIELLSRDTNGEFSDGFCSVMDITPDGRFVLFLSTGTDLIVGDDNDEFDLFLYDNVSETIERVSLDEGDGEISGGVESGGRISDDGNRILFISDDANVVTGDMNGLKDVFLRDRTGGGSTVRVSVPNGGGEYEAGDIQGFDISGDGAFVAFVSDSDDFVMGDSNGTKDVFRHEVDGGATIRVSVTDGEMESAGSCDSPSISDDGNKIAFLSTGSDLVGNDMNGHRDTFVRDVIGGTTTRVSLTSAGGEALNGGTNEGCVISGNGNVVAFGSSATNMVAGDTNGITDVFVRDLVSNTTERVSVSNTGQQADQFTSFPSISQNGRFVGFSSSATTLDSRFVGPFSAGFLHDRVTKTTATVNIGESGEFGIGNFGGSGSSIPYLANNGEHVFDSGGTNMLVGGTTENSDVYQSDFVPKVVAVDNSALRARLLKKLKRFKKKLKNAKRKRQVAKVKKFKKKIKKVKKQLRRL
ncbi:MAG: hypothetical protein CMO55_14800 [Verrucomicrobiales bacterium]|nr:hypothetical protein [Verrucomicrobiales bacterium]